MKRLIALLICFSMILSFYGCSGANNTTGGNEKSGTETESKTQTQTPVNSEKENKLSGKTLRVGTMPVALGLPVQYAYSKGWFEDAGLDVEIVLFASGAPINEAMAAKELDVAVSGMASVYALATGLYTYIGDGSITLHGEAIYARPDSDIVENKGVLDGTFGSAETVKGKSILGPLATTAHFMAIKYVESFGLTSDDFNMVSMEYEQAYQAFIMGEGDLLATKPPYTTRLEEAGYVQVCSIGAALGSPLVNANYVQNEIYEERYEDLKVFMDCYYRACEELNNDPVTRKEFAMDWYAENGITFSDSDMDSEIAGRAYPTLDILDSDELPFGLTMTTIGEFFTTQGMINEEDLPNILNSINNSIVKDLKKERTGQS